MVNIPINDILWRSLAKVKEGDNPWFPKSEGDNKQFNDKASMFNYITRFFFI